MKKIFKIFLVSLVFLFSFAVFFGIFFFFRNNLDNISRKTVSLVVAGHSFNVEIAEDEDEKSIGLGGRQSLCTDCGMLFVFNKPGKYAFWMKDMLFSLDILWIKDKKVVFIEKNISFDSGNKFVSSENADSVLEINAGIVDSFGIRIGDFITVQ
ncbi:MAG: DUF192 domain-containing protein [Candidatus Moranbacteria bacterium]|nr:DUF192 domain-containing protein [Candidatus Moranbacteria bacterium]